MKSIAVLLASFALAGCSSSKNPSMGATSGEGSGQASGSTEGETGTANGSGSVGGSGTSAGSGDTASGTSGAVGSSGTPGGSGDTTGNSGSTSAGAPSGSASGAASGTAASGAPSSGSTEPVVDAGPVTLPDGSVHAIPAGYAGTPFMGMMGQLPGTIYARNYDVGGQGVAFNHPGATNCGDWPGGMAMYRTGGDCVGLSVENAQKPDVLVDGGPAMYGEIYISYCAQGEWLKYTVEVTQSGTYAVATNMGGPAVSISIAFSATPAVSTGTVMVPESVDQAQPGHEMYHVWQNVDDIAMVTLEAGVYVMTFTIVTSQANFDSFTFTKM